MEYIDRVDENGLPTGEAVDRIRAHEEGIWHRTSHVWIVRKKNGKIQVLLQKRCREKDAFPGCYDISSAGHIPAGCGHEDSALRELKEELGVDAAEENLICCGSRRIIYDGEFHGKAFHDRQHTKVYVMELDMEEEGFILQRSEVESVLWMDFDECIEGVKKNSFIHCIEMDELMMVYDEVKKGKLWR